LLRQATGFTRQQRIDNAWKDLEIGAFKTDNLKETQPSVTRVRVRPFSDFAVSQIVPVMRGLVPLIPTRHAGTRF
jgi:hypothetical protein